MEYDRMKVCAPPQLYKTLIRFSFFHVCWVVINNFSFLHVPQLEINLYLTPTQSQVVTIVFLCTLYVHQPKEYKPKYIGPPYVSTREPKEDVDKIFHKEWRQTSVCSFFYPTIEFTYFLSYNQQEYILPFTQRTSLRTFSNTTNKCTYFLLPYK
jgi:hypothetical protein